MSKSISVIEASNLYRELHKHFLLMKALKDPSGYFCLVLSVLKNVIYRQLLSIKNPIFSFFFYESLFTSRLHIIRCIVYNHTFV